MQRLLSCATVLLVLVCSGRSLGFTSELPLLYSLPSDGAWAEFQFKEGSLGIDDWATGTFRISSVGTKEVNRAPHRWIEIKTELKRHGETQTTILKLLVAEKALREGQSLVDQVPEAYRRHDDGRIARLPAWKIKNLLRWHTFEAKRVRKKWHTGEDTEIATHLGKVKTRHVSGVFFNIAGRSADWEAWLTEDVPFGWARVEETVKGLGATLGTYRVEVCRTGNGAKSEVDESITKSPKPAYLYHLPADGTWVEFDVKFGIEGKGMEEGSSGTLRISSVGKQQIKHEPYRWIEIKLVYKNGDEINTYWVKKVLVAEKAVSEGVFEGLVAEGYEKQGLDGRLKRLSRSERDACLYDTITVGNYLPYKLIKDQEAIVTKLGRFTAKHMMVDWSQQTYEVWLTNEIPFGWAKALTVHPVPFDKDNSRFIIGFEVSQTGKDAKSELKEAKK